LNVPNEKEIANASLSLIKNRQMIVEGSAGLALATLLKNPEKYQGKNVVLIVCGRRLSSEKLEKIMSNPTFLPPLKKTKN